MLIIKNILSKININPFFYFIGLLCIITGLFKQFIIMYLIVFIHELGHIFMALLFKFKINKINIYPFGGYTLFEYDINTSFIKEFFLFFGGILFQTIFFLIAKQIFNNNLYTYKIIKEINLRILLFNLIPIIPLDGGKVLNILLNKILPFKISHLITIYFSFIFIILLIYLSNNLNLFLMILILLILTILELKKHKLIFNMFIIERYIKNIKFNNINFINKNNIKLMKKYSKNIFIINNKYIDEKEIIKNKIYNV